MASLPSSSSLDNDDIGSSNIHNVMILFEEQCQHLLSTELIPLLPSLVSHDGRSSGSGSSIDKEENMHNSEQPQNENISNSNLCKSICLIHNDLVNILSSLEQEHPDAQDKNDKVDDVSQSRARVNFNILNRLLARQQFINNNNKRNKRRRTTKDANDDHHHHDAVVDDDAMEMEKNLQLQQQQQQLLKRRYVLLLSDILRGILITSYWLLPRMKRLLSKEKKEIEEEQSKKYTKQAVGTTTITPGDTKAKIDELQLTAGRCNVLLQTLQVIYLESSFSCVDEDHEQSSPSREEVTLPTNCETLCICLEQFRYLVEQEQDEENDDDDMSDDDNGNINLLLFDKEQLQKEENELIQMAMTPIPSEELQNKQQEEEEQGQQQQNHQQFLLSVERKIQLQNQIQELWAK